MEIHDEILQKASDENPDTSPPVNGQWNWEKLPGEFVVPNENELVSDGINSAPILRTTSV